MMRLRCGRADGERPAAGRLQALLAVGLGQIQQPQARAVALLGVRAVLELPLHDGARAGADVLAPVQQPSRRPLHVLAVRTRHVLGQRRVPALAGSCARGRRRGGP